VTALAYVGSLACLGLACRGLAVSLAYPIWAGVGGALAVLLGVLWFKEPLGATKLFGVALVLAGVTVLHGFGCHGAEVVK
jgi:small multidrug resistance pump